MSFEYARCDIVSALLQMSRNPGGNLREYLSDDIGSNDIVMREARGFLYRRIIRDIAEDAHKMTV